MSLRVACIGAGYFAQFHHDAWRRAARADLVGVCDQVLARAEASGAPAFSDMAEMLAQTRPDIVDIATPPPTHADAIRQALEVSPKAIICQKPFATSLKEARTLTELAQRAKVPLIIHENFRFQPWYRAIHTEMQRGTIGEVLQASFRLRPGDGQGPRAYLDRQPYFQTMPRLLIHETGVHFVDIFRFLLGTPCAVYGDLRRVNPVIAGEDAGYFTLDHPTGARALFDGNRLLDHAAINHRLTMGDALIEGTTGTLNLSGDGAVTHRRFGEVSAQEVLPAREWPGFAGDCVAALCNHVVDALLDGTKLENPATDYLSVMETVEAIYRSDMEGRKIDI